MYTLCEFGVDLHNTYMNMYIPRYFHDDITGSAAPVLQQCGKNAILQYKTPHRQHHHPKTKTNKCTDRVAEVGSTYGI